MNKKCFPLSSHGQTILRYVPFNSLDGTRETAPSCLWSDQLHKKTLYWLFFLPCFVLSSPSLLFPGSLPQINYHMHTLISCSAFWLRHMGYLRKTEKGVGADMCEDRERWGKVSTGNMIIYTRSYFCKMT